MVSTASDDWIVKNYFSRGLEENHCLIFTLLGSYAYIAFPIEFSETTCDSFSTSRIVFSFIMQSTQTK